MKRDAAVHIEFVGHRQRHGAGIGRRRGFILAGGTESHAGAGLFAPAQVTGPDTPLQEEAIFPEHIKKTSQSFLKSEAF